MREVPMGYIHQNICGEGIFGQKYITTVYYYLALEINKFKLTGIFCLYIKLFTTIDTQ